jgi:hypothetical protein
MEQFERILILENGIEAQVLGSILVERHIPHRIQSYHDSAYDGLFQAQKGWGVVLAPLPFKETITSIYRDLPLKDHGRDDKEPDDG